MHEPLVNWGLFHRGRCNDEEAAVPLPPHLIAAAFILLSYNVDVAYSYDEDINSQFFFNGLQMWNNTTTKVILVLAIVPLLVCSDDSVSFVICFLFLKNFVKMFNFVLVPMLYGRMEADWICKDLWGSMLSRIQRGCWETSIDEIRGLVCQGSRRKSFRKNDWITKWHSFILAKTIKKY